MQNLQNRLKVAMTTARYLARYSKNWEFDFVSTPYGLAHHIGMLFERTLGIVKRPPRITVS